MGDVLVSINCITYNQEDYIGETIESFLMQKTNFSYEILIGEDCSTDRTREIVKSYEKRYPGTIKIITSDQNVGARNNSQRLRDHSKGKYIAICEGDDYWIDPYKLQKQIDYMEANPGCSLCFHAVKQIDTRKKPLGIERPFTKNQEFGLKESIARGGRFMPTVSKVYRKTAIENLPQFYFDAPVGDYPLQIIVSSKGFTYYMDEVMAVYRVKSRGSWSTKLRKDRSYRKKWRERMIKMLSECDKYTDYKYSKEIEDRIIKLELDELIESRHLDRLKEPRYQDYIRNFNRVNQYKFYARAYFPHFYKRLSNIKQRINGIKSSSTI